MASPEKVKFHYIKSTHFKNFFASGAFGGVGPNGLINMGFYNERVPIPTAVVYKVNPEGALGEEILAEREGKTGVVREIDCNIMMTVETARSIKNWLEQQIKILEAVDKATEKK